MYDTLIADTWATMPIILVAFTGVVIVIVDCFRNDSVALPVIAAAGLIAALVWEAGRTGIESTAFFDLVRVGGFASYVNMVILLASVLSVLLSVSYLNRIGHNFGEVHALVLFATVGAMILGTANNLITVFVGLETMSICLYALTGLVREDVGATESALKYFLLGAFSTGFFLYGIALLYGSTGTMYFDEMGSELAQRGLPPLFWAGIGLLLVGFMFKVSVVPFHMWTPDVYQGAPTTLTGYMATASKTAAFAALLLVLWVALPFAVDQWRVVLSVIALVTMVVGNVLALSQDNVKRMLAYSSIAHAGYILVGLAAGSAAGYSGVLYYLLAYVLMNIGAFGVMAVLEWDDGQGREQTFDSLAGVGLTRPLLGVTMAFFMFSLAGFPPLAGFIGKVRVFAPAIEVGLTWLVVIGVLMSVLSAYYYLRVLFYMFMRSPDDRPAEARAVQVRVSRVTAFVLVLCALSLLWFGIVPTGVLELTEGFFR
jgi:NADH-quinone oxidoreductase subunit N